MKGTNYTSSILLSVASDEEANSRQHRRPEAIVLGNGPSLRGFDFRRLSRFDVFGMNAAYRYWYEIGWFPQYYSCLDLVVGSSHREAITELIRDSVKLGIRAFLLRQTLIRELGKEGASSKVFNFDLLRPGFDSWIPGPVTTGSHTCAWASIMGYKDIYLLGIDCNYVEMVANAQLLEDKVLEITDDAPNPNYFFDAYQKKGDKFNIPNPRKDLHLQSWRNVGEKISARSRVLNAGLVSKVDQFPFVRFDDVERGGRVAIFSPPEVIVDNVRIPSGETTKQPTLSLCKSDPEARSTYAGPPLKHLRSIVAYNAEWHTPEITEQHAFCQAAKLLPEVPGVVYFGFPWATLIERLNSKQSSAVILQNVLNDARASLDKQKSVITVCQHSDMLRYQDLFMECGITHVFWSHTVKGQNCFPKNNKIQILPFPQYPVQATDCASSPETTRKYLYSFVEPKSKGWVTSSTTEIVLNTLTGRQDGYVIPSSNWDFDNVLQDAGSQGEVNIEQDFVKSSVPICSVPIEVARILRESIFSICPSGPNSTRLWESIGCGAIPVVLSDNYLPPGNKALWELATVSCPERLEDISALPERLAAIARDKELLDQKPHAMRQLWMLYGPDCFIYDIQKLFLSFAGETAVIARSQPTFPYGRLYGVATEINRTKSAERSVSDVFILGCSSRVLCDPSGFLDRYKTNTDFRNAYKRALRYCSLELAESIAKALDFKQIVLEPSREK